jgi:2-C-methyl-D-erythritol 4-phosphate cytidylyltransferase
VSVTALLLAAGRGTRLGADVEKALVPLAGRPLFAWSLEALQRTPAVESIVVVGNAAKLRAALATSGGSEERVIAWCAGGKERQQSVALGLARLPEACDFVLVHDSARALVTPALIARCIADARELGAAIVAAPLDDTVKRVALGRIEDTVPRAGLWRAQTPQVFRRDWFEQAHAEAASAATDDAALVEALGKPVHVVLGEALNFKVTTPADLALAEAWLTATAARH